MYILAGYPLLCRLDQSCAYAAAMVLLGNYEAANLTEGTRLQVVDDADVDPTNHSALHVSAKHGVIIHG
jgi:hypothetical protein